MSVDFTEFVRLAKYLGRNVCDEQTGSVVRLTGISVDQEGDTAAIVDLLHTVHPSMAISSRRVTEYDEPKPSGY